VSAEFYKDIVKVIIWNQKRTMKLSRLVFITEEKHGRPFLECPDALRVHRIFDATRSESDRRVCPARIEVAVSQNRLIVAGR
jgi:hypothetical protein